MDAANSKLMTYPVTPQLWPDLAALFERPGPRGGRPVTANCWCAVWRWPLRSPGSNKEALRSLVDGGEHTGLLAYREDQPVGWVSVAPREQFASLRSSQFKPKDDDTGVFVISCFAVDRTARGHGIGRALVDAAVRYALDAGATAVEAFPGQPTDYKGKLEWFLDYDFEATRTVGKRTVVRYTP
ncbi:GNAT family N-acetyltransferase [Haloechinothrix sp. YIM 98757]|uniref:GNAT family N-acetyltransferase n=1 Tax=Haloechinothrix aidingensis TaxID=2752311 RepID=A0A838A9U3_9PSEU|nr:GNAT family N-acetyltransferase [Haloechinothrix aidingensis]MBA0125649.1 GNAT family N-acetyltransferase [Haloechinothrix aidingensis]